MNFRKKKKAIKKLIEVKKWASDRGEHPVFISNDELLVGVHTLFFDKRFEELKNAYESISWPPKPRRMLRLR